MNQDLEHLHWLSIGFYVNAAVTALFSCIPFIHLSIGIAVVSGSFENDKNSPPAAFGWFFIAIASVFILSGFALAVCNFFAARFLKRQTKYLFCFVLSCVNCMFAPLGTILGIFSIIVLVRDSVKALFTGGTSADAASQFNNPPSWQ